MADLTVWRLFLLIYLTLSVEGEEIYGTFFFEMSWNELKDTLTHEGWTLDESGTVRVNSSGYEDYTTPVNVTVRKKRAVPTQDYVRHGSECLKRQASLADAEKEGGKMKGKSVHSILMVVEEEEARMTCHYCDKHERTGKKETRKEKDRHRKGMLWYKLSRKKSGNFYQVKEVSVDMSDNPKRNRVYVTETHTLIIRKTKIKHAGTYFCRDSTSKDKFIKPKMTEQAISQLFEADDQLRFLFHLDILKVSDVKAIMVATGQQNSSLPQPAPPQDMVDLNVRVLTVWEEWSACSVCGVTGTRRRLGPCAVQKIDFNKTSNPLFLEVVIRSFVQGIPCRSSLFHGHKKLQKLVIRPDEVQEESCDVSCENYEATIKDILIKPSTENIKVLMVTEPEGDPVSLKCPKSPVDMPVAWLNGTRVLVGPWLKNQPGGRVLIDTNNSLRISYALPCDTAHYACVIGGEMRGQVKLQITPKPPECIVCRYGLYLLMSYPFDFAVFCFFFYVRHKERQKVLNYDLLPLVPEGSSDDSHDSEMS